MFDPQSSSPSPASFKVTLAELKLLRNGASIDEIQKARSEDGKQPVRQFVFKRAHDATSKHVKTNKLVKSISTSLEDITLADSPEKEHHNRAGFFDLPRELRDKIYDHVITKHNRAVEPITAEEALELRLSNAVATTEELRQTRDWSKSIEAIDVPIPFVNPQFYLEALEIWVKKNIVLLGGNRNPAPVASYGMVRMAPGLDYPDPHDEFRKRAEHVLQVARHVRVKLYIIDRDAWWLKLLQEKTNLRTVKFIIRNHWKFDLARPGNFGLRWCIDEEGAKEELRALVKVKVLETGSVLYACGVYRLCEAMESPVSDWIAEEINPLFESAGL